MSPASGRTDHRRQARADTRQRIIDAARLLLVREGSVTLRAVARELGMTAPALYRYAASHDDLVLMVALAIDADVSERLTEAAAAYPEDDPLARLVAGAVAFRGWALTERKEFALVFTNVDVSCAEELQAQVSTGMFFSALLFETVVKHGAPVPALDDLDPGLAEILRDPLVPADLSELPDELRGLVWLLERAWAGLYGTVTLEVFGHVDPRIVEQGHLFRAMIDQQAIQLGLIGELPRMRQLVDELLIGAPA